MPTTHPDPVALGLDLNLNFKDSASLQFGNANDAVFSWDGTQLELLPTADDTGAFNIGDGTTDFDFKVFLGATTAYLEMNVGTGQINIEGAELHLGDSDKIEFGDATAGDVTVQWNATDLLWTGAAAGAKMRLNTLSIIPHEIADPGNAGAIVVTDSGFCNLVTTGAQTRTMAIPPAEGLEVTLNMLTDGGDAVVTVASAMNAAGNNTLTFGATSDVIRLVAIDNSGTLAWRTAFNDGVALSTV